jgi:hypothetical protein
MKQSKVQVGGVYDTKVSGKWVRVRVERQMEYLRPGYTPGVVVQLRNGTLGTRVLVRFRLTRLDNGKALPKVRPASALHENGAAVTRSFHLGVAHLADVQSKKFADDGTRLTDCCGAYSTFMDADEGGGQALCCKGCYRQVDFGQGDGSETIQEATR